MASTPEDYQKQLLKQYLGKVLGDMAVGTAAAATPIYLTKLYNKTIGKDTPDPGAPISQAWKVVGGNTPVGISRAPMRKFLRRLNVSLTTGDNRYGAAFLHYTTTPGGKAVPGGKVFAPIAPGVSHQTSVAILGHEAGHAVRHNLRNNRLGRIAKALKCKTYPHAPKVNCVLAGLAGLMPADSLVADAAIAGGGLLYSLPQLSEEIGASRVGARLLRLKGLSKLRTFIGVPTYAISALAPAMAVGVRRGINKLRDSK